jgi:hypothetical protein
MGTGNERFGNVAVRCSCIAAGLGAFGFRVRARNDTHQLFALTCRHRVGVAAVCGEKVINAWLAVM